MRPSFRTVFPRIRRSIIIQAAVVSSGLAACMTDATTENRPADRITIVPAQVTLAVGESRQLDATAWSGNDQVPPPSLIWSSSDEAVATVTGQGLVTGVGVGDATITAAAGSIQGMAALTVMHDPPAGNAIDIYPSVEFQTMTGWEAAAQAGELECPAVSFQVYRNQLFDAAVTDLGLNRLRVEVRSGAENPVDGFAQFRAGAISESAFRLTWYQIVNDNSDPQVINPAGFNWSHLDFTVDNVVTPIRQRLIARGERLYVNLNYVDFGQSTFEHTANPAEYAELMLAAFQHLQSKYGWVPDAVEVVLEPDNTPNWRAPQIGAAIVAAGDRLAGAGYRPAFIAPSTTSMTSAVTFFDAIMQVPRVREYLTDLSYHRYAGVTSAALAAIGDRAAQFGVRTGMLEHIGSDHDDLFDDLTVAGNSSWQQFALAFCVTQDDGGVYYMVDTSVPASPVIREGSRTRFLKQYFRHVRLGATRIGAASGNATVKVVAFRNQDARVVVVLRTSGATTVAVRGLPPGTYGAFWTTASQSGTLPDATLAAQQSWALNLPNGVTTLYRK